MKCALFKPSIFLLAGVALIGAQQADAAVPTTC
jgi:hypothetical protein